MLRKLTRRDMINGSMAATLLTQYPLSLFGGPPAEEGGVLIPFLDAQPPGKRQTRWQDLTNWHTKTDDLYVVSHYNTPALKAPEHVLEISGLVRKPLRLTLGDIKARKRKTITATLECGGNGLGPGFMGAIGNIRWTGTPLADLLADCGPLKRAIEVVKKGEPAVIDVLTQPR